MPLDDLPNSIVTPTRDKVRDDYARDYGLRSPEADTGPGAQPYVDASSFADAVMPLYGEAKTIGAGTNLRGKSRKALEAFGRARGIPPAPASGGTGFIKITTSVGGGTIFAGDELSDPLSGTRLQVTRTDLYTSLSQVPTTAVDTGPSTNLPALRALDFTNPRPGVSQKASVLAQTDGSGLSGGRNEETNEEYIARIEERLANPAVAGSEAEYIKAVEGMPGLGAQKAFAFPAVKGPGSMCVAFTMFPATPGGSRLPNAAQISAALAYLIGKFPGDDNIFVATLIAQLVTVGLKITWRKGVPGWVDAVPWPAFVSADPVYVAALITSPSEGARLSTGIGTVAPQVGQTIALYDTTTGAFKRKRLGTVTQIVPNLSWDVLWDQAFSASDAFTPAVGALVSPWSDSLNAVAPLVAKQFDGFGPGEQEALLPDPGRRQRRQPESPAEWPSVVSNKIISPVLTHALVGDASIVKPTIPTATITGTLGVAARLLQLGDLAIYKS